MTETIVLHQWEISPFCRKVAHMLDFKGLPFETVNYNGLRGMLAQRLSPIGKLPVLDILGQRVQDSTRIARFLDEHFPDAPLYPAEPQARAQVELWEDWADEVLYWFEVYFRVKDPAALDQAARLSCESRPAVELLPVKLSLKLSLSAMLLAQGLGRMNQSDVEAEFSRHLDRIDTLLSPAGWLVGESKTVADIAVGSQLLEVVRTSPLRREIERRPRLAAWIKRI